LFIRVQKQDDMALIPLDQNFSTRSGTFWPGNRVKDGHLYAWGTTAQGVYKVGDTVQFKFYVRNQSNRHWVEPPQAPYALKVIDPKGEAVLEMDDVTLSEFGAYCGEFKRSRINHPTPGRW
jgi:uncharacterized protein YfaS (alpha-2-macroglobulin family)